MTVQHPHRPWPQVSRAPVRPNSVCSSSTRLWCGCTSAATSMPLSLNEMVRAAAISIVLERVAGLGTDRAEHRLRIERQLREADADGVVDCIRHGRRNAEHRAFTDALSTERAVRLLVL